MSIRFLRANSGLAAVSQGMAVNVIALLATLVGGILTARGLGPEGRGQAAALIALPTFMSFVATAGLPSALVFEIRRQPGHASSLATAALILGIAIGTTAAAISAWAAPWALHGMAPHLLPAARLYCAFILAGLLSNLGIAVLQAHRAFAAANALRLAQPLLQVAGIGLLWATGTMTPSAVALVTLAAGLPGIIWNLLWIANRCTPRHHGQQAGFSSLAGYAARAAGGELLAGLGGQMDKIILVALFSPTLLGLYVVAMSLSRVLALVPTAVVPVLFPSTAGQPDCDVARLTSRAAAMTALCVGGGAVALGTAGPALLAMFYGAEFRAATWGFRILLAEAALSAVAQVLAQAYLAMNRPALYGAQQGLGVVVGAVLLYILSPKYGIEGAAVALLAASVTRLAGIYWSFDALLHLGQPRLVAELGPGIALIRERFR